MAGIATIVVTPRSASAAGHAALHRLRQAGFEIVFPAPGRQPNEEELVGAMGGCVGYLAGVEPVTRRVIGAAPDLRIISRNGVGIDNIDLAAVRERDIRVTRATGANARAVAELAIGHMIGAARDIPFADRSLKSAHWERRQGIELHGRCLGLLGCGSVGQIVAGIALGMGMKVRAYDPSPPEGFAPGRGFSFSDFDTIIKTSDVISLHCPPLPGEYLIGAPQLDRMKAGAIIVNTARDGLVDPAAAAAALDGGRLWAFTIDAFAREPPDDYAFIAHPRVLATPHIGGFTGESIERAMQMAVTNILDELA